MQLFFNSVKNSNSTVHQIKFIILSKKLSKINPNFKFVLMEETFKIGKYFTYKDKQLVLWQSNVVYTITCNCGDSYIGQTKRNLQFRI